MLLAASLRVVHILRLNSHASGAHRPGLDVQIGDHGLIVLADWSGHLIEVAGRGPIRRRLNLEVATGTLEAVDLSHVLGAVNRIVDLKVL